MSMNSRPLGFIDWGFDERSQDVRYWALLMLGKLEPTTLARHADAVVARLEDSDGTKQGRECKRGVSKEARSMCDACHLMEVLTCQTIHSPAANKKLGVAAPMPRLEQMLATQRKDSVFDRGRSYSFRRGKAWR